jgi:DNA ligase D-like protein (predicted 3'-phosphoesterase)
MPLFVVQKHFARALHFDLRLRIGSVLKSWAVPKGVPGRIGKKHLAIATEDHALSYASFEGIIPQGEYGAGRVVIWDRGEFENLKKESLASCLKRGILEFKCSGDRVRGCFALVRMRGKQWLWIKMRR